MATETDARQESEAQASSSAVYKYVNWFLLVLAALIFALGAWQRRWISDDGLIVLRTVGNLLDGFGPVYNIGERVEVNTSPAWTYVLAIAAFVSQARLEYVSLFCALTFSVAAIAIAIRASGKLYSAVLGSAIMVPFGMVLYIAVPQARDFATSGLETGLTIFWISVLWLLCVNFILTKDQPTKVTSFRNFSYPSYRIVALILSFWAGLGSLVRPELALYSIAIIGFVLIKTTNWGERFALVALFSATPVIYQIFRMGYYGLLVPNTAVAKEANDAQWGEGFNYISDLVQAYALWLPVVVLTVVYVWFLVFEPRRSSPKRNLSVSHGAGVITIIILALSFLYLIYIARVGGDFMRGRMLLPVLFSLCLPLSVIPIQRKSLSLSAISFTILATWGGVVAVSHDPFHYQNPPDPWVAKVVDERLFYIELTGVQHPVTVDDYSRAYPARFSKEVNSSFQLHSYVVWRPFKPVGRQPKGVPYPEVISGSTIGQGPALPDKRFFFGMLGVPGMMLPGTTKIYDPIGLAYPEAAHGTAIPGRRIGHNKEFPVEFFLAGANGVSPFDTRRMRGFDEVAYQRGVQFWQCKSIRDLHDSYTAPMTFSRFLSNFFSAPKRTLLRYDVNGKSQFC